MNKDRKIHRQKGYGLGNQEGSAAIMVVLLLPVMIMIMGLVVDLGILVMYRGIAQSAADLGALAAAQNLNVERLEAGVIEINVKEAKADAIRWVEHNMHLNMPHLRTDSALDIFVEVYNVSSERPTYHRFTGRLIDDPTVCVLVKFPHQFLFFLKNVQDYEISLHSDASVVTE